MHMLMFDESEVVGRDIPIWPRGHVLFQTPYLLSKAYVA
jgi:hypothetical protein